MKKCLRTCADSDYPAYVQSIIQAFAVHFIHSIVSNDFVVDSEGIDQTTHMHISLSVYTRRRVFAWRGPYRKTVIFLYTLYIFNPYPAE